MKHPSSKDPKDDFQTTTATAADSCARVGFNVLSFDANSRDSPLMLNEIIPEEACVKGENVYRFFCILTSLSP